jgi:hypothetical protein
VLGGPRFGYFEFYDGASPKSDYHFKFSLGGLINSAFNPSSGWAIPGSGRSPTVGFFEYAYSAVANGAASMGYNWIRHQLERPSAPAKVTSAHVVIAGDGSGDSGAQTTIINDSLVLNSSTDPKSLQDEAFEDEAMREFNKDYRRYAQAVRFWWKRYQAWEIERAGYADWSLAYRDALREALPDSIKEIINSSDIYLALKSEDKYWLRELEHEMGYVEKAPAKLGLERTENTNVKYIVSKGDPRDWRPPNWGWSDEALNFALTGGRSAKAQRRYETLTPNQTWAKDVLDRSWGCTGCHVSVQVWNTLGPEAINPDNWMPYDWAINQNKFYEWVNTSARVRFFVEGMTMIGQTKLAINSSWENAYMMRESNLVDSEVAALRAMANEPLTAVDRRLYREQFPTYTMPIQNGGGAGLAATTRAARGVTEAEALAPLQAEALGGQRIWYVGPEGAGGTVGLRYHADGLVTADTMISGKFAGVRRYSGIIENHLGVRGPTPKLWLSGVHGTPEGLMTRSIRFLNQDMEVLGRRTTSGWTVGDVLNPGGTKVDDPAVTFLSWCNSSAFCR